MDTQEIINYAFAVCGFLGGWVLKVVWESIKEMQKADIKLTEKVSQIELLVAGQYVKNERFEAVIAKLFDKIDKIHDIVQTKADR
jgi:hypothetical protein